MPGKQENNLAAILTYCSCNVCLVLTGSWIELPLWKKKSSESILLLFSSEIQQCYISYPVATIYSQRHLLVGKYCPIDGSQTWKLWFLSKGADSCINAQGSSEMKFLFLPTREQKKKKVILLFRAILHAVFVKAVIENQFYFIWTPVLLTPYCTLQNNFSLSFKQKNQERA